MALDGAFIEDAEATEYVNEAIEELYEVIFDASRDQLFAKNATVLADSGVYAFTMPSDFYRLVSLAIYKDSRYYDVKRADALDYQQLSAKAAANQIDLECAEYFIRQDFTGTKSLFVFPEPAEDHLAMVYIPVPPSLVLDTDTLYVDSGWAEYVATSAAVRMKQKQEGDTQGLLIALARVTQRIEQHLQQIDDTLPTTVRKIRDGRQR